MKTWDRILRAAFVGVAVGMAWSLRGHYGLSIFPGALLGMGFAYVSGQRGMFKWMPLLGAVAALGISNSNTTYGLLHAYASNRTFVNYSYGLFTLTVQGGAWGCFGCCFVGLLLEKDRLKASEWVSAFATILVSGLLLYYVVVNLIGFHINPGRSDELIAYTGGVIGLFVWLILNKKRSGLRAAFFGYIGFGLGMSMGRFLANVRDYSTWTIGDWKVLEGLFGGFGNIMELIVGLVGGFVFTYGMLGKKCPDFPEDKHYKLLSAYSIFYILAWIPILVRLRKIPDPKRLERWTGTFGGAGYPDPAALAARVPTAISIVCVIAVVGALVWLFLHSRNKYRFAAFPILCLAGVMVVIHNIDFLYFFIPLRIVPWKMFLFPGMLLLMILYVIFAKRPEITEPDEVADRVHWGRWVVGVLVVYALMVVHSGPVNKGSPEDRPSDQIRFQVQP